MTIYTLWIQDQYALAYSQDYGSNWTVVDLSSLPAQLLSGIAGPTNVFKVYIGVEGEGIYTYNGSWTLEHSIYISTWYASYYAPKIWCATDDSFVIAVGTAGDNKTISTRDGPPGTSWTDYNYSEWIRSFDVSSDGSAIFGISRPNSYDTRLHKRAVDGTWSIVATINGGTGSGYGTIAWDIKVVSDTEVWLGGRIRSGSSQYQDAIWKWNGSTISLEYQSVTSSSDGRITTLWMADDGSEGWATSDTYSQYPDVITYIYYDGTSWSEHSIANTYPAYYPSCVTQIDGEPTTAKVLFNTGGYVEYNGTSWSTSATNPFSPLGDYGLFIKYIAFDPPPTPNVPFLRNKLPVPNSTGVNPNTIISVDVLDEDSDLTGSSINVYVKGDLAYNGASFIYPFNGPGSSISATTVDGYDGYHIEVDSYNSYSEIVTPRVEATDDYGNSLNEQWAFIVGSVNILYFSDGYGLKAVDLSDLVGESQSVTRNIASTSMVPTIPANNITDIFGNWVRDGLHLVLSYNQSEGYGAAILTNETDVNLYMEGYRTEDGQINDYGTLYIINKDLNRVEAYYGADFRDGYGRSPDYYYSTISTPSIFHGEITCLHIESDASSVLSSGTRLYIGTTLGFTRVDTYDAQVDGYSSGLDGYGISNTYSISGGGATHQSIGGNVSRVAALASDEEKSIIFVATNNNSSDGGVTQISLEGNSKIIFMTKENNMLPSNNVRDIFGKEI